jgi:hypothetical protein
MPWRSPRPLFLFLIAALLVSVLPSRVLAQASSSSSTTAPKASRKVSHPDSRLDTGAVSAGVYRNKALGLSCKIPEAWVLRTEEMNARESLEDSSDSRSETATAADNVEKPDSRGRVLLAAFSRPPEARAEDVNSSIVIAAESVATYPGLKEAAQYFGPLTEVAKAQGFKVVEEPYEFAVGTKTLARADFQKEVGTRVMRQSTLVLLARGWAVSVTFIAGTEDEVEGLIDGLSFAPNGGAKK